MYIIKKDVVVIRADVQLDDSGERQENHTTPWMLWHPSSYSQSTILVGLVMSFMIHQIAAALTITHWVPSFLKIDASAWMSYLQPVVAGSKLGILLSLTALISWYFDRWTSSRLAKGGDVVAPIVVWEAWTQACRALKMGEPQWDLLVKHPELIEWYNQTKKKLQLASVYLEKVDHDRFAETLAARSAQAAAAEKCGLDPHLIAADAAAYDQRRESLDHLLAVPSPQDAVRQPAN